MIDGLIGGKLYGKPVARTGNSGKAFVTAKVRTPTADGGSVFVNVIAFDLNTASAILGLDDGDSVSLAGMLTPKVWLDKNGEAHPALDLLAQAVLTAYHVTRKRQAVQQDNTASHDPVED